MRWPTNSTDTRFSIPFGGADSAARFGRHAGIDINVPVGTDVFAPISGVVTAYTEGTYHGRVVEIRGDDGNFYHMLHNSKLLVNPGSRVTEGNLVAKSGATGQGLTGAHVHFGVATKSMPNITSFTDFIDPNSLTKGEDVNVTQDQLDKICWLATGLQAKSNQNFQNNLGNPLDTVLDNFMGYTETKDLHLDAEAYRSGQTGSPKVIVNDVPYVPSK